MSESITANRVIVRERKLIRKFVMRGGIYEVRRRSVRGKDDLAFRTEYYVMCGRAPVTPFMTADQMIDYLAELAGE